MENIRTDLIIVVVLWVGTVLGAGFYVERAKAEMDVAHSMIKKQNDTIAACSRYMDMVETGKVQQ